MAALIVVLAVLSGATPAWAADCVDTDGDLYVTCDSCTAPSGTQCGDCAEGSANVNPGAAEFCGDGVDNNCDGNIDFDRGAACSVADGLCLTNGIKQCLPDGSGTFCQLSGPLKVSSPEGPAGSASCFDAKDNDCDGLTDHAETDCRTTELCNGFDDDFDGAVDDGFNLGSTCSVGVGGCQRTGVTICASGGGTQCSVTAGAPSIEGPAGAFRCSDTVDNDCDGATDLADASCQTAEACDGLDNDGDGTADEDFADLGEACSKGVGACEAGGVKVCRADGTGTTCNAPTVLGSPEGPSGATCADTVDNDCDGTMDAEDPSCGSALLKVACALPEFYDDDDDHHHGYGADGQQLAATASRLRGDSGRAGGHDNDHDNDHDDDDGHHEVSCEGKHKIFFKALNAGPDALVSAELIALDKLGNIALDKKGKPLPILAVHNGEKAHLKSRIKGPFVAYTTTYDDDDHDDDDDGHGNHGMTGSHYPPKPPKPPSHTVSAPVPLLRVTVQDGGRQAQAFCSIIPYMQVFQPDGTVVSESEGDVTNFVAGIPLVDPASLVLRIDGVDVGQALGVNPATCTPDAPCSGSVLIGGHSVGITDLAVESATKAKYPSSNSVTMTVKDLGCGGHLFVLDGERTPRLRKTRYASACHKDDILDNRTSSGFGIELTSPGVGEVTDVVPTPVIGKVCHGRPITSLDINGLAVDLSGQTFAPGDGLTTAGTYTVLFDVDVPQTDLVADLAGLNTALGTFDRGSNRLVAGATDDLANRTFDTRIFAVAGAGELTSAGVSLAARGPDILGITREAVADTLIQALAATDIPNAFVLGITGPALNTFFQGTCNAATALVQQKINDKLAAHQFPSKSVDVPLACDPTVHTNVASVSINGNLTCNVTLQPGENKLTVHVALPPVAVNASAHGYCIDEIDLGFLGSICLSEVIVNGSATITMSGMSVTFAVPETLLKDGGNVVGTFVPGTVSVQGTGGGVDVNCLSGVLYDIGTFFSELFGGPDLTPSFEGVFHEVDLTEKIGVKEFEIAIKQVKVNEQEVAAKDKLLTAALDTVDGQAGGLQLTIKATFSSTSTDPEVEDTPGALLTPAPPPSPGAVPGAGNTFFVVADDAFNQLFASMTTQGELRTTCKAANQTIAELAPDDCTTLGNIITRGACQGLKGTVCSTLPLGERPSCNLVRNKMTQFNIASDMPFLFCGRLDVPPQLLIQDDPGSEGVETHLRLNDLLASVVLDRDRDGVLAGDLPALPKCIQAGTGTSGDCRLLGACLDLNLETSLVLDQTGGKLKLIPAVEGIQLVPRPAGVACEGGINFGDVEFLQDASANDPLQDLMDNVDTLTPPLQSEGLDLGGIVLFSNPRLIAIETGGSVSFQDYVGVTGDIVPKP